MMMPLMKVLSILKEMKFGNHKFNSYVMDGTEMVLLRKVYTSSFVYSITNNTSDYDFAIMNN